MNANKHRHAGFAPITGSRCHLTQDSADLQLQILVELDYFIYMVAIIIYITFYIVSFFNSTIQCEKSVKVITFKNCTYYFICRLVRVGFALLLSVA